MKQDYSFRPHYYGPYSPEVDDALDELMGAGFVNVTQNIYGIDYDRGFELKRYDYELSESGYRFFEELQEQGLDKRIKHFIEQLNEIGNPDYLNLSFAAKVDYLRSSKVTPLSREEIQNAARALGWRLSDTDINKAQDILAALEKKTGQYSA